MITGCVYFIIKFLFLLQFGKTTLVDVVTRNHGAQCRKLVFRCIDLHKKLKKAELDVDFLKTCKTYDVFPKFLRFKLYKKSLHSSQCYKTFQYELLDNELSSKIDRVAQLDKKYLELRGSLQQKLSFFEFRMFRIHDRDLVQTYIKKCEKTHEKKLQNIGVYNHLRPCDPNRVIHNLSSKPVPERVKTLLAFGLDFSLPCWKLSFFQYHLAFEKLINSLSSLPLRDNVCFDAVKRGIVTISHRYFHNFKTAKVFSPIFSRKDISLLRNFASDKSRIVTRPDKGKGVVIIDRSSYVDKLETILNDRSKFVVVSEPILKTIRQVEDKINRLLSKLKSLSMISEELYKRLYVSGSTPGILYGLPKIHKALTPLRPIFSACGTPAYGLAKFFVPILAPLTKNEYTVLNSYEFVTEVSQLGLNLPRDGIFMASFDVESLFTNIPLHETIDICMDSLFSSASDVLGITSKYFRMLLELAVTSSYFVFNGQFYRQKEGVGMGLPLGPTFANVFMCFHEKVWLSSCPAEFAPVFYRRYVDDCFILFKDRTHADLFLNFLNNKHRCIKFTMEKETNGSLPFLDVLVRKEDGRLETSVYRKPSFSGLGTSFFSSVSKALKFSAISSAIFRAYHISSSYASLHLELERITIFFTENGFPSRTVHSFIRRFLSTRYKTRPPSFDVPKLDRYFPLPYFGAESEKMKREVISLLTKVYPFLNPRIVLRNPFSVSTFFKYKDRLPKCCQSSVVYEFSCASCGASYVGSTLRNLHSRIQQHLGKSVRTGKFLTNPDPSPIRDHSLSCDTPVRSDNFSILGKTSSPLDLRILESLHIFDRRPSLNNMSSSFALQTVR